MTQTAVSNTLEAAIIYELKAEIQRISEEEIRKAQANIDKRIRGKIGEIATRVASEVDFRHQENVLRIQVRLPEPK